MKLVIQRVSRGSVKVNHQVIGQIKSGFMVLVGFKVGDTKQQVDKLAYKLLNLRIMPDASNHMNLSLLDTQGELLLIPQFTLYSESKGHRPSFTKAMPPKPATKLFNYFIDQVKLSNLKVTTGKFGAMMDVELINSGPVTIILEN